MRNEIKIESVCPLRSPIGVRVRIQVSTFRWSIGVQTKHTMKMSLFKVTCHCYIQYIYISGELPGKMLC